MWLKPRTYLIGASLAAAAALAATPALACSCAFPRTPGQHLERSDVVFKGRVLRSTGDGSMSSTTFRVDEVLKGPAAKELTVQHALSGAACGLRFAQGGSQLVFAHNYQDKLSTNACSQAAFSEAEYRAALPGRR
jgi:hypothetical protein